jgi:hypothetical protein
MTEQARYQVRFDLGIEGARAAGSEADVIVWASACDDGLGEILERLPATPAVISTALPSAFAAADWVLSEQLRLKRRFAITVIAAGVWREGTWRYVVEDHLVAGAVIARLSELGLDATSPEAAAAEAACLGLRRAVSHLLTATTSAMGEGAVPEHLRSLNASATPDDVTVVRGFVA